MYCPSILICLIKGEPRGAYGHERISEGALQAKYNPRFKSKEKLGLILGDISDYLLRSSAGLTVILPEQPWVIICRLHQRLSV